MKAAESNQGGFNRTLKRLAPFLASPVKMRQPCALVERAFKAEQSASLPSFVAKLSPCTNRHQSCPDNNLAPGRGCLHIDGGSYRGACAQWAWIDRGVTEWLDDVLGRGEKHTGFETHFGWWCEG